MWVDRSAVAKEVKKADLMAVRLVEKRADGLVGMKGTRLVATMAAMLAGTMAEEKVEMKVAQSVGRTVVSLVVSWDAESAGRMVDA